MDRSRNTVLPDDYNESEVSPSTNHILRVEGLNVFAGDHHILKNINVEIPRNKITVLLGPSGCGKTTLLK